MLFLISALSLGFMGSFHCVGMCGPIALALPLDRSSMLRATAGSLSYSAGRILTYAVLGVLMGLAGKSVVIAGYQRALTLSIGIILLGLILLPSRFGAAIQPARFLSHFISRQKNGIRRLFERSSLQSLFLIGSLNGLLPCGFVYLGLAGALAAGDTLKGAGFMAAFGLGTLPAMLVLSVAGNKLSMPFRNTIRKVAPVIMALMALLFILRGLNLGIPYLSPNLTTVTDKRHACCHK